MKRKITALFLIFAMCLTLLAGCGGGDNPGGGNDNPGGGNNNPGGGNQQVEKIKIYVPTSGKYDDMDKVMEAVNAITREKIGVEVEFKAFQFGQWFQQYSLFLSGTEDVDILANYGSYLSAVAQGAALDLTDLLQEYGQDIVKQEGDFLKSGQVDGVQYAIPIYASYAWNMGILYREDVVEELGLEDMVASVKTIDDWGKVLEAVKDGKPEMTPFVSLGGSNSSADYLFNYGTWDDLGNAYGVLMDGGKTSEVVNLFATDEYAHLCEVLHDWNVKGYSSKDIQTQSDAFTVLTQNDAAFSTLGQTDFNASFYQTTLCGKPIGTIMLGGGIPVARTYNNVTYTIMSNTKHAEACMKFLNLWFSDKEVGTLINCGIEGEHYVLNEDGLGEYPEGQDANSCSYHLGSNLSNINRILWCTEDPNYAENLLKSNNSAQKSVALGFAFNPDNVTNEITELDNICAKYRSGLECGALDPATALPEFLAALEGAGINNVIAEKQAQLDAFLGK